MGQWITKLLGGEQSEGYLNFPKTEKTGTLSIKEEYIRIALPYFDPEPIETKNKVPNKGHQLTP